MKNNQTINILDFTSDHLVIYKACAKNIAFIQAMPFQLTLNQQMCKDLSKLITTIQIAHEQSSVIVDNFYRILPLIAYEKELLNYIWQLFFSLHKLKGVTESGNPIILIIPLKWEPNISISLKWAVSKDIDKGRVTVLTDYFCVWFYQFMVDYETTEAYSDRNALTTYSYAVYRSSEHQVVYPMSDYSSNKNVVYISFKDFSKNDTISPFVRGCHHYLFDNDLQSIVFDLQVTIGIMLNNNVFYPMCTSDIAYGQYMHQSITFSRFHNGVIQVMAALEGSSSPDLNLMRMEINYQSIDQYRPVDIYLVQRNAMQGHLYVTQTFNTEQKIIGEQLFSLPELTR